ncbi:MAG: polysaccharide deacetylase family protein [Thermomicrobiales bacterium]
MLVLLAVPMLLSACGGGGADRSGAIQRAQEPSTAAAAQIAATAPSPIGTMATLSDAVAPPRETPVPGKTIAVGADTEPTADAGQAPASRRLSATQLKKYKPDELGVIPILEYHQITVHPGNEAQFVRPIEKFKADLQWFYDHDFYIVSLHDIVTNRISATVGKHPLALTFDDSTVGQFRFLIADDGSVTVDPRSAVGILEAFFAEHPDFGRGGFFAVLPVDNFCFSWQGEQTEPDQIPFCGRKITWLLDHGYEVGNHTLHHVDLKNVDDETFRAEIGGAFEKQAERDPRAKPEIMAMPFGNYPDKAAHAQQRQWLRDGFDFDGASYKIIAALMVGSEPTVAPDSIHWDPLFLSRIQAFDGSFAYWQPNFTSRPEALYTSDGNPDSITVPNALPVDLVDTLDAAKVASDGKELIRY